MQEGDAGATVQRDPRGRAGAVCLGSTSTGLGPGFRGRGSHVSAWREGGHANNRDPQKSTASPQKLYYHGEPLNVNVHVTNNSTKTVKKIKVSGRRWGIEGGLGGAIFSPRTYPDVRGPAGGRWGAGRWSECGGRQCAPPAQPLNPPHPTVRQYADICLFSTAQYKCPVAQIEQE